MEEIKLGLVEARFADIIWNNEPLSTRELVALCDVRPEMMEQYPGIRQYTDYEEMLSHERLDIVDICLPTYLHADYAVKTMERGIHVICEKPISLKKEDVARVYGTAKKQGVCFMVAQVLRFWTEYEFVREVFEDGRYGKLLSGHMSRLGTCPRWSWDGWMRDENRSGLTPYDLHIHDLDYMVYAFGKPQSVQTHRCKRPEQDYLQAVYQFDGFFISAEAAWYGAHYPFSAGFRFQFEDAVIANEGNGLTIYQNDDTVLTPMAAPEDGDTGAISLPKTNAYANEIRYFTDCVKEGRFPDKVRPDQLETVIDILNSFAK